MNEESIRCRLIHSDKRTEQIEKNKTPNAELTYHSVYEDAEGNRYYELDGEVFIELFGIPPRWRDKGYGYYDFKNKQVSISYKLIKGDRIVTWIDLDSPYK